MFNPNVVPREFDDGPSHRSKPDYLATEFLNSLMDFVTPRTHWNYGRTSTFVITLCTHKECLLWRHVF